MAEANLTRTGPLEQPRVRPWSTQLDVPTDAGTVWLKVNCAAQAFEPALHPPRLTAPDEVDEPLAFDGERGWMLTRDREATLGESHASTADDWRRVVRRRRRCNAADHGAPVIGAGCGRFIARQIAERLGRPYYDFAELLDCAPGARETAAVCAPAVAVGLLAERELLPAAM